MDVFNEKAGSRLGSTLWTISAGEGLLGRVDRCLAQATIDVLAARDGGSARLLMQFSVDSLVDEGFSSWLTERFVEAKLASDNFIVGFDTEDVVMHLKDGARLFAELADIGVETALMNFGRAKNPFLGNQTRAGESIVRVWLHRSRYFQEQSIRNGVQATGGKGTLDGKGSCGAAGRQRRDAAGIVARRS